MKTNIKQKENVTCVITKQDGSKKIVKGHNIVTTEGNIAYAQKIVNEATSFDTPFLRLGTGTTTPDVTDTDVSVFISGSDKAVDSGFPQRNNSDPGNTDGGVDTITWKISYAIGDLNVTGIAEGALVDNGTSPTKALNHFLFSATFDVTSTDQLTVYVNHKLQGV